jgi:predicted phosphohydrolase
MSTEITNIYAISDLHLSGNPPYAPMEKFGPQYTGHIEKLTAAFMALPSGSVVINGGDISWTIRRDEAIRDFKWLNNFGVKFVHTIGNHDFYWDKKSAAYMTQWALANDLWNTYFADHNHVFTIGQHGPTISAVKGTETIPDWNKYSKLEGPLPPGHDRILPNHYEKYKRRLEMALAHAPDILVAHIPPFNHDGSMNELTHMVLGQPSIKVVIYGHRHNTAPTMFNNALVGRELLGEQSDGRRIFWVNALCERMDFKPKLIARFSEEQGVAWINDNKFEV